jgi:aminoglycoside phosphotransferase family enzyme
MALPDSLEALLSADAYPHPCGPIELIETHISWVILTGEFAYKLKKPVSFNFVDFSTLTRREHFCREEVRCNRSFAPALYLDVVPVTAEEGMARVATAAETAGRTEASRAGPYARAG